MFRDWRNGCRYMCWLILVPVLGFARARAAFFAVANNAILISHMCRLHRPRKEAKRRLRLEYKTKTIHQLMSRSINHVIKQKLINQLSI